MKNLRKPSKLYAQAMLITLVVNIPLCFVIFGLLLLIPIGAWQVLDALVWVARGDKRRHPYLILVTLYLVFLSWIVFFGGWQGSGSILPLFTFIIVPYLIAFGYWYITHKHANELEERAWEDSDEGILDEGLVGADPE